MGSLEGKSSAAEVFFGVDPREVGELPGFALFWGFPPAPLQPGQPSPWRGSGQDRAFVGQVSGIDLVGVKILQSYYSSTT